jgi:hypothetical protein
MRKQKKEIMTENIWRISWDSRKLRIGGQEQKVL